MVLFCRKPSTQCILSRVHLLMSEWEPRSKVGVCLGPVDYLYCHFSVRKGCVCLLYFLIVFIMYETFTESQVTSRLIRAWLSFLCSKSLSWLLRKDQSLGDSHISLSICFCKEKTGLVLVDYTQSHKPCDSYFAHIIQYFSFYINLWSKNYSFLFLLDLVFKHFSANLLDI